MAAPGALGGRQQDALVAFLRALADGELAVEEARCRLCEDRDFDPYEVFRSLQGSHRSRKGWVNAYDLHAWLSEQPHGLSSAPLEDVAAMLSPHTDQLGELPYEDFLRLALPTNPEHAWLREVALARSSRATGRGEGGGGPSPDVAYRLCQLLEREMDTCRRLKFHRKALRELMVHKETILQFLDSEQGVCAGLGGLISPSAVRCVLTERLRALTWPQCAALLRRINPSDTRLAAFDSLAKYLSPPPPPLEALLPGSGLGSSASGLSLALRSSAEGLGLGAASPRPPSPAREPVRSARDLCAADQPEALGGALRSSRCGPPPRLQEPGGPQRSCSPRLRRAPSPTRDSAPRTAAWQEERPALGRCLASGAVPARAASLGSSSATPPPAFVAPAEWPAKRPLLPREPSAAGGLHGDLGGSQGLRAGRERSPPAARRPASPQRPPAWLQDTPERRPQHPDSTRAPATEASRLSPSWELASASRCGAPWRPSPARDASPQRSGSLPPQALGAGGVPAWPHAARPSPAAPAAPPLPPLGVPPAPWPPAAAADSAAERRVRAALQTMARQAELDAQIEDSKVLIPKTCPLESIFNMLDRSGKGYLSDMDLWQFDQDFGGPTPFGSFCALVHELRLRRQPRGEAALAGRLGLRDVGLLLLPVASQEYNAVCFAESDDEAKSVLYLLANSEPCPTCGMRVQRSADSAGCPSVTCPLCGACFRCFCVVSDQPSAADCGEPLPAAASRYQLHRLLSTSARAADELERERKRLAHVLAVDMCALSDAFCSVAGGRPSFGASDLRRAFYQQGLMPSENELSLLWRRYAKHGSNSVAFPEFAKQLQPCNLGLSY